MIHYRRLRKPSLFSFDLDDTLYDNRPVLIAAERALKQWLDQQVPALAEMSIDDWRAFRWRLVHLQPDLRHDMTQLRQVALAKKLVQLGESAARARSLAEQAMQIFLTERQKVTLFPETLATLEALAERVPVIAITNGNADPHAFGLGHVFSHVFCPQGKVRSKPYPDMFELAQQQYNHWDGSWLHVGDHGRSDVHGAITAGWQAAWLCQPLAPNVRRPQVLPHLEFSDLARLTDLL